jgi:hypothetical protein
MSSKQKALVVATFVSLASFAGNGAVFVFSYSRLAFPFLTEEQRVANAEFIMSVTVGAYAAVAALTGILIYWLCFKRG